MGVDLREGSGVGVPRGPAQGVTYIGRRLASSLTISELRSESTKLSIFRQNFHDSAIFDAERLQDRYDLDHYGSSASRFRITDVTSGAWDPEGWEWCLTYPMWVALY